MPAEILENIAAAAQMLWQGMLGVFVVLGIIALLVYLLGRITGRQK